MQRVIFTDWILTFKCVWAPSCGKCSWPLARTFDGGKLMIGFGFILIFGSLSNDFLCWWWMQGFGGLRFVVAEGSWGRRVAELEMSLLCSSARNHCFRVSFSSSSSGSKTVCIFYLFLFIFLLQNLLLAIN